MPRSPWALPLLVNLQFKNWPSLSSVVAMKCRKALYTHIGCKGSSGTNETLVLLRWSFFLFPQIINTFPSSNMMLSFRSSMKSEHLDRQNNDVRALRAVRNSTMFSLYGALNEGPYRPLRINFLTFNSLVLSGLYSFLELKFSISNSHKKVGHRFWIFCLEPS